MRISGLLWCHQGLMYPCKHFYVAITKVHIFRELSMETLAFFYIMSKVFCQMLKLSTLISTYLQFFILRCLFGIDPYIY